MAGDLIRVSRSSDRLIPSDTLGVIVGEINQVTEYVEVVFDPEFPIQFNNGKITSKGRITEKIRTDKIYQTSSDRKTIQNFFQSKNYKENDPLIHVKNLRCSI